MTPRPHYLKILPTLQTKLNKELPREAGLRVYRNLPRSYIIERTFLLSPFKKGNHYTPSKWMIYAQLPLWIYVIHLRAEHMSSSWEESNAHPP